MTIAKTAPAPTAAFFGADLGRGDPAIKAAIDHELARQQQQIELSAVVIGANPNALLNVGKAFKAGVLSDADLQFLSGEVARREFPASSAPAPAHADEAQAQARRRFLDKLEQITLKL